MSDNTNTDLDNAAMLLLLQDLQKKHRHMDDEITALLENGAIDIINIARMKKLKLRLKDRIRKIHDNLTPDIIA